MGLREDIEIESIYYHPILMSTTVDEISPSQLPQASPFFDLQEFRSRSRTSDDSLGSLPAIDLMSICSQPSQRKTGFGGTENRSCRANLALIPAVAEVDGSSPPQVSGWGYKPVTSPSRKEYKSPERRHSNTNKEKPKYEMNWDSKAHSPRWVYSFPAFHCRSPPAQLYKFKKALKFEHNSAENCDFVPGMSVHQAILFRRSISSKCLPNNPTNSLEYRKHNNTPVFGKEAPRRRASMVNVSSIPAVCRSGNDKEENGKSFPQPTGSKVAMTFQTPEENLTNLENKCSLCASAENQDLKNFVQSKKTDIKLPCLDTNHKT
ncbi:hypothetical protein AWC38_SpisGene21959 [Stylophora pistillata]|uniref:Uncharacterized protein n=1 Tax=Stylophora pistillata TaxID=50429 RepID=A0A2B4R8G0_STYPI|nr:hypothetical protein AWC38_SpisGene21959 [Stylophora pistillata]